MTKKHYIQPQTETQFMLSETIMLPNSPGSSYDPQQPNPVQQRRDRVF